MSCLVVGASRGIGLSIAKRLLLDASTHRVLATYRSSPSEELDRLAREDSRVDLQHVDVTDDASLDALANVLEDRGPLDLAIHAAGILHERELIKPEKSLRELNAQSLTKVFAVNALGPIMVARAIFGAQGTHPLRYAALSAMVGSITDNKLGGWYGYRASKAALNQLVRTLSIEVRRLHASNVAITIHPGTTDTQLSKPFQSRVRPDKLYSADQSAERILRVLHTAKPLDSGKLFHWDGSVLPY